MKIIQLSDKRMLAVDDIPSEATHIRLTFNASWYNVSYRLPNSKLPPFGWIHIKLPPGSWIILGRANEITEQQAKEIVDDNGMNCYDNYKGIRDNRYTLLTALESFHSLITANNITGNPLILIEK